MHGHDVLRNKQCTSLLPPACCARKDNGVSLAEPGGFFLGTFFGPFLD